MKVWDDQKTDYLFRNYSEIPARDIAAKLGLKLSQIFDKAKRLRDEGYDLKIVKRRWSPAEHNYLIKYYAKISTAKIAEHLGRTPIEITSMAGILRKSNPTLPHKPAHLGRG